MITYGSTTLTSYNTITKIEVYYYKSTSATSLSGGSWSTTKPTWENGKYIWQKIRTTYEGKLENGLYYSESDPVNITGQQGATGTAAYSYKLNASDTSITVSKDGTYSKTKVTFSATYKQGTGAVTAYAGRFKIETTANGTTWTTQYTSSANESSKEYTIPTGVLNIRCSLYQAGGTSVLLDIVSVAIVTDGIDGIDGADGTSQNLLLDVYASSLDKVKAPWDRYLSDSGNATITGQFIAEDNLPDPNATHFYRITDSSASTKSRGLCFYNGGTPPFLDGHTYRIGCWVRNHTGSPSISFYLGNVGSWTNRKIITNTNWEWIECVHTFGDTDPAINAQSSTYKRIYFYFSNNNVEGSSLDMCGFKVEEVQTNISTARNYLLKTENLDGWGVTGGTTISNGIATFPEVTANTWREFYPTKNFKYEIIRNKNIIFSVRVKADVGKICACNLCIGVDSTETAYTRQKYTNNFVYFTGTGEWQTICVAIPISDEIFTSGSGTPNYDNCWVTVRIGAVSSYHNSFQATQPQLSLGTTATAWSIAPEDVEASMQEKVDNIEIGGRNLLLGSAQKIPVHWSTSAQNGGIFNVDTNIEVSEWRAKDAYRIYGQAGSTSRLFGLLYGIPFTSQLSIQNQSYTFSIFVKNQANVDFLIGTNSLGDYISIAPGESKRVVTTVIGNGSSNIQFTFSAATNGGSYDAILWHPKIEFGNKVTDWSPAPEDNLKGTNIEPFFSHDITDIYDPETNPNGYWMNNGTSYGWTKNPNFTFTQLEDGWLHVHIDNSSGTGTIRNDCCVNRYNPFIKRATKYTFLAEFRNNQSTGAASGSDFYLVQQSGSVQFWGQNVTTAPLVHLDGIGTVTIPIFDIPSDGRYTFSRFTKYSEPEIGSTSHWTEENDMMVTFVFRANAGAVLDYDVRLSVYEGEYWGGYVPYIISDVTDIRKSAEDAHYKIDNMEIGGRNLIPHSKNLQSFTIEHIERVVATYLEDSCTIVNIYGDSRYGIYYNIEVEPNATYTFSFYASDISGTNVNYAIGNRTPGQTASWSDITKGYQQLVEGKTVYTFTVPDTITLIRIYFCAGSLNGTCTIKNVKLEKGNKPTDWSPAPEDLDVTIGARNLLLDSHDVRTSQVSANGSAYILPSLTLSDYGNSILNTDDYYTYSFDYEVTGNTAENAFIYVQIKGSSVPSGSKGYYRYVYNTPSGKYVCTFKIDDTQISATSLTCGIRLRLATDGATFIVKNAKLEKGNRATDWTPAPEDTQAGIDTALAQSVWYATCADAGATKIATIVPETNNFVLNVGTTINVKFTNTNSGAVGSLSLNVNGTGAKNIKYIYNKTLNSLPAVDYIAAGSTYLFVYDGTYWVIQNMNYNTNETNHILNNFSGKTGELGIWQTGLFMKDGNGTYQNICTDSSGNITRTNANTKKANPNGFEVGSSIYLSTSGTTYAANANITGAVYASYGAFDSRYSLNTTLTANCLTPYQPVYLVGTINNGLYYLDTIWWTQTPNDSTKVYVLVGGCYDSTTSYCRINLYEQNNWYKYVDGALVDYTNRLAELAATTATSFIAVETNNHGIYVHPENDMSTGWKIGDAIELFKGGLSYIKLWIENNIPKIRIGKSDQGHVLLDNNSVDIKNNNDVIATFGETTIIGKENEAHLQIGSTGIYGQNSNNSNDRFFEISQNNGVETIESRQSISEDFSRNSTVTKQFTIKLSENKIDDKIKYSVIVFDKRTSLALYVISSREFSVSFLPKTIYISPDSGSYSGTITISEKDENNNLSGTMVLQQEDVDLSLECHLSISYSKLYTTPSFTFGSRIIDSKYGGYSTVNGLSNIASGNYSYAGGKETIAEGDSSFAMGTASEARKNHSVAIGEHVIAKGNNQTVIGCYNEEDDESLFVIGNGEDLTLFQTRSNALTVDQTGNIFMYLDVSSTSSPSLNTTDGLLYSAITALGWETDIITTS